MLKDAKGNKGKLRSVGLFLGRILKEEQVNMAENGEHLFQADQPYAEP